MAKNYTDVENTKADTTINNLENTKARLLDIIMNAIDSKCNTDYIVKLSEIYNNIK